MSFIKNLIKEPESKLKANPDTSETEKKVRPIIKSALDLQRLKLEKLMKNPDKPVVIPEHKREKDFMQSVPTFVRNVMGSSAGAGSGEFHVYRHLRRKEYARQKMIQSKSHQEQLDEEYQQKLEENRREAEERTAKKRAKRLKKKYRGKKTKQSDPKGNVQAPSEGENFKESESETEHNKETDKHFESIDKTVEPYSKEENIDISKETDENLKSVVKTVELNSKKEE